MQSAKVRFLWAVAALLTVGFLWSTGMAAQIWWTLLRSRQTCGTPAGMVFSFLLLAAIIASCLLPTVRALLKKKNAA
jgi:hypothetical protein